jgi:SNF2 family DNA or RNA helicase
MKNCANFNRLDLTAANRAYIIEPHWNPAVEEQALARIHRLGQTREITTIRYVMDNTYEDVSPSQRSSQRYD